MSRKINFGAGPAKVPEEVLQKAQAELLDYNGLGISVLAIGVGTFAKIIQDAERLLRELMGIPDDYEVLFMHGGGTGQFAAIPLNISFLAANPEQPTADYLITGTWSQKAAKEAEKFIKVHKVLDHDHFVSIPPQKEWKVNEGAAYLYYCANETIHGVEFQETPQLPEGVHLVADISSNILSRPIDVRKHSIIVAGTQKNLGIGGLTIVIVRKDLIGHERKHTPGILSYADTAKNKSLYNTPCVFAVYITKLVLEWIKKQGGVEAMEKLAKEKSQLLYETIDGSDGFYAAEVQREVRSRMNVPFRVRSDPELEAKFLAEAAAQGMISLKGHRSVGGIRASLYNAVSLEETRKLVDFMKKFQQNNS
ncbi:Phosphoserine aminotransferase [Aphelenchoides fujianensis]|nr:Phosphoserine aminotransferase [Aphelenchoides fujianensis]